MALSNESQSMKTSIKTTSAAERPAIANVSESSNNFISSVSKCPRRFATPPDRLPIGMVIGLPRSFRKFISSSGDLAGSSPALL